MSAAATGMVVNCMVALLTAEEADRAAAAKDSAAPTPLRAARGTGATAPARTLHGLACERCPCLIQVIRLEVADRAWS